MRFSDSFGLDLCALLSRMLTSLPNCNSTVAIQIGARSQLIAALSFSHSVREGGTATTGRRGSAVSVPNIPAALPQPLGLASFLPISLLIRRHCRAAAAAAVAHDVSHLLCCLFAARANQWQSV